MRHGISHEGWHMICLTVTGWQICIKQDCVYTIMILVFHPHPLTFNYLFPKVCEQLFISFTNFCGNTKPKDQTLLTIKNLSKHNLAHFFLGQLKSQLTYTMFSDLLSRCYDRQKSIHKHNSRSSATSSIN